MNEADSGNSSRHWPELSLRCGAIPFRTDKFGDVQFLLIRRYGESAWSAPKGHLIPGSTMAATAATESFEEAGVYGSVFPTPLGSYRHLKRSHPTVAMPTFVEVVLFSLEVETEMDVWPEMAIRERRWFDSHETRYVIEPRALWNLISPLYQSLPALAMNE